MGAEIATKSLKIQGCVAGAFLDGFGSGFGRQNVTQGGSGALSLRPFWEPFLIKNRKNSIQKSMPKMYRKMMPKESQNDAKMDAKIDDFSIFAELIAFRR